MPDTDYPLTAADCRAILEKEPEASFTTIGNSGSELYPPFTIRDSARTWALCGMNNMRFRRMDAPEDARDDK